jgi:hypothetical protein
LEVIIAFTILVIVLVPTASLYGEVVRMAADTRNRVEAANLASQQIDEARATPFATLAAQVGTPQSGTEKDAGMTYTVTQSSVWVDMSNVTNACGGTGNGGAGTGPILSITETVTWANMRTTHPVVTQTDIAPPKSYYTTSKGNFAVSVADSEGNPVVGATVTFAVPSTGYTTTALTDQTGCAFAPYLPAGLYNITVQAAGDVSQAEQSTYSVPVQTTLGANTTVAVPSTGDILYGPPATINIGYAASPIALTATAASFAVPSGGPSTSLPTYPVTAHNGTLPVTFTTAAAPSQALNLWPYPNSYDIYPGGCADNDPLNPAYSPLAGTALTVSEGSTTAENLQLYSDSLNVTGQALQANSIVVTATDGTSGCTTPNNTLTFMPTVTASAFTIELPLGTWTLTATAKKSVGGGSVSGTFGATSSPIAVKGNGSLLPVGTVGF